MFWPKILFSDPPSSGSCLQMHKTIPQDNHCVWGISKSWDFDEISSTIIVILQSPSSSSSLSHSPWSSSFISIESEDNFKIQRLLALEVAGCKERRSLGWEEKRSLKKPQKIPMRQDWKEKATQSCLFVCATTYNRRIVGRNIFCPKWALKGRMHFWCRSRWPTLNMTPFSGQSHRYNITYL